MQAVIHARYGAPEVLSVGVAAAPVAGPRELVVEVVASPVTAGDRRMRAADFPGITWLMGRLVAGLWRPRNRVPGTVFAGRVVAVGDAVTRFAVGDDVFGTVEAGAHAARVRVAEDGVVARMPSGLSHAEAATVPYGAVTALTFLREIGGVQPGERVLVIGAAGGVGRYAVQVAAALGAEVVAVCRPAEAAAARAAGAAAVIGRGEALGEDRFDVILDTPGATRFGRVRRALRAGGRFLTLHITGRGLWDALWTAGRRGKRSRFGVALGSQALLEQVAAWLAAGVIRPDAARRLPLAAITEAHAAAARGEVVVVTPGAGAAARAAA